MPQTTPQTLSPCRRALQILHSGDQELPAQLVENLLHEAAAGKDAALPFAALLALWSKRGETGAEIAAGARFMRDHATKVPLDQDTATKAMDVCGTGGTGKSLLNCSTTASFLVASLGVKVAKHGNHSTTRSSGSADFFAAAGIELSLSPQAVAQSIEECGLAFIYARAFHPIMANIAPVRAAIGVRTIFNLLGPLSNPAGVTRQLVGVADPSLLKPIALALQLLGAKHALVVCSHDGLDEVSPAAPTQVLEATPEEIKEFEFEPSSCGISHSSLQGLEVADATESLELAKKVLSGEESGIARDYVALNAGFALYVAGAAPSIEEGIAKALETLGKGTAAQMLARIRGALS